MRATVQTKAPGREQAHWARSTAGRRTVFQELIMLRQLTTLNSPAVDASDVTIKVAWAAAYV